MSLKKAPYPNLINQKIIKDKNRLIREKDKSKVVEIAIKSKKPNKQTKERCRIDLIMELMIQGSKKGRR